MTARADVPPGFRGVQFPHTALSRGLEFRAHQLGTGSMAGGGDAFAPRVTWGPRNRGAPSEQNLGALVALGGMATASTHPEQPLGADEPKRRTPAVQARQMPP
jgi:hypothetical protein